MFHGWQHLRPEDREAILRGIADGGVHGGPYHLELDWVDKCNARCFFCNSAHIHDGASIPWERAEQILEQAVRGGLRSVRLAGGGEPTLHPNFPDLLRLLARHGVVLDNLTTNGTLLTEPVLEALKGVRVGEIRVSLNYSEPEAWAEGMGLPARQFERTVANIRRLGKILKSGTGVSPVIQATGETPVPQISQLALQFFVTRSTATKIRDCYALARGLGADLVLFRELWGVDAEKYFTPQDLPQVVAQMEAVIRDDWERGSVVSHLESHGIGAHITEVYERLRAELGGNPPRAPEFVDYPIRYCYIGWYSMTILGSQAAYPCCYMIPNTQIPALGDLRTASLEEIWRGPAYARFRSQMRDYFLLQRKVPFFGRRATCLSPACATHTDCPITRSMCDEAFYREAECRLVEQRARMGTQIWRFINRAGRTFERKILKRPN